MSDQHTTGAPTTIVLERTYRADVADLWALWTTAAGFASWWGPQGFRAEVHELDARVGGALRYDMIADTPAMVAAMAQAGQPPSHANHGRFTEVRHHARLGLAFVIDFLPGVEAYDSAITVDFATVGDTVRMVVTLGGMHNAAFTKMQEQGFTSQLTKLDPRFG